MNFIDHIRELTNSNFLIQTIIDSGWMEKNVIIVNCSPEYSSRLTQLVNHKLSYLNGNEPYEQVSLDMPTPHRSQVFCTVDSGYVNFERYLLNWLNKQYLPNQKYLFVTNTIFTGKNLRQIKLGMQLKGASLENIRFASLYCQKDSKLKPDFNQAYFTNEASPVFFWENKNEKPTKRKVNERY